MNSRRRAKRLLILLAAGLLAAFAAIFGLERYLVVERPMDRADAILVLAGGAEYKERNIEAARLYRAGVAPVILLSNDGVMGGWDNERGRNPYFAERARWLLSSEGVPDRAIHIIPERNGPRTFARLHGTEREAATATRYAAETRINSLFLVTSAQHTRRALAIFETEFAAADVPAQLGVTYPKKPAESDERRIRRLRSILSEAGKLTSFRLRGLF